MTSDVASTKYQPEWWESLFGLTAILGGWALRAWVASVAWRWYVVPLGAEAVGFWWMAVATWAFPFLLAPKLEAPKEPATQRKYWERHAGIMLVPLIAFVVLAAIRGFSS
jgi:hypothetical protein